MAHRMPRLRLLVLAATLPFALWMLLPVFSDGAPLSSRIEHKKREIQKRKGKEQVLTTTISGFTERIGSLQDDITVLQTRQVRIQTDLDAKRRELAQIQDKLRQERIRLVNLRERLAAAKDALAERLVEIYKSDEPDVVTVILEADGFEDLITRAEFIDRVGDQDGRIIDRVRIAKTDAVRAEAELDRLEDRQRRVTAEVDRRLREVESVKGELVDRRDDFAAVRDQKQSALASTREERHDLEGDLRALEKEQAAVLAKIQAAQNPSAPTAGPIRQGSGSMIWPVNGTLTSPFGYRWGRLHAGIDIAAPEGTPIRAADSGRVILLGWTGGYGNYTCISHSSSISTCYGHQSRYGTSMGASVSKGQVIGYVGNTGHSFGAHLHFEVRINGNPVDPMGYL